MMADQPISYLYGTAPVRDTAVFEMFIKATPEAIWEAITTPELRARFNFGVGTVSEWTPDSPYVAAAPNGFAVSDGKNLLVDPPRRLVQSMTARWSEEVAALGPTRVSWEIEQVEDSCRLTVVHDRIPSGASAEIWGGWPQILSGLKTLLETSEDLTTPGSLSFGG